MRKRLDELVERYDLASGAAGRLRILLERLATEGAPTSVHDPAHALDVHVADSLVALDVPEVRAAGSIADLGAGAGLPSLVLAAALPDTRITAVESNRRKASFIATTAEAMGLSSFEVVPERAEEWKAGMGACDVVTARALGALPVLCEYAAPLLREGGMLIAWKGTVEDSEVADGSAAAEQLGLSAPDVRTVKPYRRSERRSLHLFTKVEPTPAKFPRRSGMAAKKPLRANPQAPVDPSAGAN
jgi:16S rRNA (guanine527-N7)-methyltransferase